MLDQVSLSYQIEHDSITTNRINTYTNNKYKWKLDKQLPQLEVEAQELYKYQTMVLIFNQMGTASLKIEVEVQQHITQEQLLLIRQVVVLQQQNLFHL